MNAQIVQSIGIKSATPSLRVAWKVKGVVVLLDAESEWEIAHGLGGSTQMMVTSNWGWIHWIDSVAHSI